MKQYPVFDDDEIQEEKAAASQTPSGKDVLTCKYRVGSNCSEGHQAHAELSSRFSTYYCPANCSHMGDKQ